MIGFLKPAPDATTLVPEEKIASTYKLRQTGVLLSTCIGYIGYYIIRLIFTTEQENIMKAYHFSTADIGLVLSCFGIGYGISKLFMGALADKSNTNRYLATGLIGSAILNVLLGSSSNLYVMMILMLLISITQGMGAASCQKAVQQWWGKAHRGTIFSIWSSAHNAGAFCCVAIVQIATLLFTHSIPAVFYTASVVSLLIAGFVLLVGSDRPTSVGLPSIADYSGDKTVLASGEVVTEDSTDLSLKEIFIKYILTNKIVWMVSLTSMSIYIVRYGIMSWIPSYLPEYKGFSESWAKWLVGIFELSAVPWVIIMGSLSDFLKGRRALVCLGCLFGLVCCLTAYFFSTDKTLITFILFVMGGLIYAPGTLVGLMVNEAAPKFAAGSSTGFMGFFQYMIGETAATALIGFLVNKYGWTASFAVLYTAVGIAIALAIVLFINERKVIRMEKEEGMHN